MSTHSGFVLVAVLSLVSTLPLLVFGWRRRSLHRELAVALYLAGYALIGATLLLDPVLQPPLFLHGFVPGMGAGLSVAALALILQDLIRRGPGRRAPE
jgi:hypothetical protein